MGTRKSFAGGMRLARTGGMISSRTVYVRDEAALTEVRRGLKLRACPRCRQTGFLISHGALRGYGARGSERVRRGQRVFCSNRYLQRGCGRTFAVLFSLFLKSRLIPAAVVRLFLGLVINGSCRHRAWLLVAKGFSVESGYRVWRDWLGAQAQVRSGLCRRCPAPEKGASVEAQTWAHLEIAFSGRPCGVAAFQEDLQEPFFPN